MMLIPNSFVIHEAKVIDYEHGRSENLLLQSRAEPNSWSWQRLWNGCLQAGAHGWGEKGARAMFNEAI